MKAYVYERYGSPEVLKLQDVSKPVPGDGEVLVKIHATSVNAYDWHLMRADPFLVRIGGNGFFRPKVKMLAADIAGRVEAVGPGASDFEVGDAVFGSVSATGNGGFAEYVCAGADYVAPMPEGASFEEAAAVPMAGLTALQGLRDAGKLEPGQKVAINGASGGVGTFAVQIAKALGAEVTAVCSTKKMDLARSLGADHVVDYTQKDFTANGSRYDLILGVNGFQPLRSYRRALSETGIYMMAGGSNRQIFQGALLARLMSRGRQRMGIVQEHPNRADLVTMKELMEAGKVRSVIDRTYSFEELPQAVRYLEEGHAAGKVVVTVVPHGAG